MVFKIRVLHKPQEFGYTQEPGPVLFLFDIMTARVPPLDVSHILNSTNTTFLLGDVSNTLTSCSQIAFFVGNDGTYGHPYSG